VLDVAPGRTNLYARIKGDGRGRPLILLSHTDVVMAEPERWSVPPFSGELRGGVYGRGASDMKGAAVHVTLMRLLTSEYPAQTRCDTAGGRGRRSRRNRARSIVEDHLDLIRDAEFF
jgi:hypothetical protein